MNRKKRVAARKAAEERERSRASGRITRSEREARAEEMARSALARSGKATAEDIEAAFEGRGRFPNGTIAAAIVGAVGGCREAGRADRFRRLLKLAFGRSPKLARAEHVVPIFQLAGTTWIRDLDDWRPAGRGRVSVFRSLVRHLLVEFPPPPFLYSVFDLPVAGSSDRWVSIFARVAKGGSVRKLVAEGTFPIPLNKRMCHLFSTSSAHLDVISAARTAQVRAFGGDRVIAQRICATRLGRTAGEDEAFRTVVLQWFCGHPMLPGTEVGPLIDYMEQRRTRDRTFTPTGRSPLALLRAMHAWHGELAQERRLHGIKYDPSGLPGSRQEFIKGGTEGRVKLVWTIEEILTSKTLMAEGRAMRHCVYSYSSFISRGRTSIWSMRCDGERRVTIEVSNALRAVVQVRGVCNRRPQPREERVLRAWADEARLEVRVRAW